MNQDHSWLVALLDDLIKYANRRKLDDFSMSLIEARRQAYIVVRAQNASTDDLTNTIPFPVTDSQTLDD